MKHLLVSPESHLRGQMPGRLARHCCGGIPFGEIIIMGSNTPSYYTSFETYIRLMSQDKAFRVSNDVHHLQKYAYDASGNKLVWPFAQHHIAPYYAHDIHLRQALLGQSAVFLKQHESGDSEIPSTREELLEALQDPVRSANILKLLNRYAGNCLGTNGYWSCRKEELVSLPHLWWTLSAADLHWPDLRRFVSDPIHAPHLVDAWFTLRVQKYVTWFFGDKCEWIWWRIEYQSRGSAHAHGCSRLKFFIDLDALKKGRGGEDVPRW
jgi:hypothetical protein